MSLSREKLLSEMRRAGSVLRYHTMPTLRKQTVADHTWNVMRIYCELWGRPTEPSVWVYMLYHDALEIQTGDSPFYAKRRWPELKMALDRAEREASRDMGIELPEISGEDAARVKLADLMEMWEWGREEVLMGNKLAHVIQTETYWAASELCERIGETERVKKWLEGHL